MDWINLGIEISEICLPKKSIDLQKWSVVACDQYTSQPEYWESVESFVGDAPSTVKIVVPEIYLEELDNTKINIIKKTMQDYIQKNTLEKLPKGVIIVEREIINKNINKKRRGLILSLDLEQYDFSVGSQSLIRATEGTVASRIPPRLQIREGAKIECPHILILIDDPEKTIIEPLFNNNNLDKQEKYNFDLMQNGGNITGYFIEEEKLESLNLAFNNLLKNSEKTSKNLGLEKPLLFAAGDGNHSLACAKTSWENIKKNLSPEQIKNHPARFALCEIENIHDEALEFEPIHRVMFNINQEDFFTKFTDILIQQNPDGIAIAVTGDVASRKEVLKNKGHVIEFVSNKFTGAICVSDPVHQLEVGTLQNAIDQFLQDNPNSSVDYIHGDDVTKELGSKENCVGFLLPVMGKNSFFKTVILEGALPRKTFSMGSANQKRFYLECREIL